MKSKITFFITIFYLFATTHVHAYTKSDLKKIQNISALCSIGPNTIMLLINSDNRDDLLISARLSSIANTTCTAALEEHNLLTHSKNIIDELSKLQYERSFNGLLSLDVTDRDAIKLLLKTLGIALAKEVIVYGREKGLRCLFTQDNQRINRRMARILVATLTNGLFGLFLDEDFKSFLPSFITEITRELSGEFIMRGSDGNKLPELAELFVDPISPDLASDECEESLSTPSLIAVN